MLAEPRGIHHGLPWFYPAADPEIEPGLQQLDRVLLLLLGGYFLLKPLYVFPSGLPQPADALMLVIAIALLLRGDLGLDPGQRRLLILTSAFVGWTAIVSGVWAVLLEEQRLLKIPAFYLQNLLVLFVCLTLSARHGVRFFRIVGTTLAASLILQAAFSLLVDASGSGRRATLSFNNPNQLGYWALLSASIYVLCARAAGNRTLWQVPVWLAAAYVTVLSLSKAAMIALASLVAVASLKQPRYLLAALLFGAVLLAAGHNPLVTNASDRLAAIGAQGDDSMAARGYDRLWLFPQHLLFGSGEGGFERFRPWDVNEFHSTIGTVLFSYGIVGFTLFVLILASVYRQSGLHSLLFLGPAFVFGLTHQGLRFSFFWALIGIAASVGHQGSRGADAASARLLRAGTAGSTP
jgi:hypothetical protein